MATGRTRAEKPSPPIPEGWEDLLSESLGRKERKLLRETLDTAAVRKAVRLQKISLPDLSNAIPDIYEAVQWAERAFFIRSDHILGKHMLHAAGAYYLQEASAMAAVGALSIKDGQRVLDLCAAPGGKSGQIAALLNGSGLLVANDCNPQRAGILCANLARLGVENALVTAEAPVRLAERFPAAFDRVLVDAPCSGEGLFRKEPESRLQWSAAGVRGCAKRQRALLNCAARMVRAGGLIVYSTCTFNRIENEDVVRAFLNINPEFSAEDFSLPGLPQSAGGMLYLYPHVIPGEGQFIARMRRIDDALSETTPRARRPETIPRRESEMFGRFRSTAIPGWNRQGALRKSCNRLCWVNGTFPEADKYEGLKVRSVGIELGRFTGCSFIPSRAFAMSILASEAAARIDLDDDDARAWLSGKKLKINEMEWSLVTYRGFPIGFAGKDTANRR